MSFPSFTYFCFSFSFHRVSFAPSSSTQARSEPTVIVNIVRKDAIGPIKPTPNRHTGSVESARRVVLEPKMGVMMRAGVIVMIIVMVMEMEMEIG